MARKPKNGKPDGSEPDKPARPRGVASLDVLTKTPQFIDEHDAHLTELMAAVRYHARDCLDHADEETLPLKRARLAKHGLDLTMGYAKLVQVQDKRRKGK